MGSATVIRLPNDVRVRDVANSIAGLQYKKDFLRGDSGAFGIRVTGVGIVGIASLPQCCHINLSGTMIDGEHGHQVMYHFEGKEGRIMLCPPTPFWICVGIGLVKFFGGSLDYNDCDSNETDFLRRCPRESNDPQDGKPWTDFQQAMFCIPRITKQDLMRAEKWASR